MTTYPTDRADARPVQRRIMMSANQLRNVQLGRTSLGRRGYTEEDVDNLLERLAVDIEAWGIQAASLRADNERYRDALREWHAHYAQEHQGQELPVRRTEAHVEAVNLLSRAQQNADALIAQAQTYARQVMVQAQQQAASTLADAQQQAEVAANQAVQEYRRQSGDMYAAELEEMQRRAAWLKGFVKSIHVQLQAATDTVAVLDQ